MRSGEKNWNFTGYNFKHKERARGLRKDMTPQEKRLWFCYLRDYPVKFYRQRSIDSFIVDFYCPKARLVIELDGNQHYTLEGKEYDEIRTEILERYELKVIRFSNLETNRHFPEICSVIDRTVKVRLNKLLQLAEDS